MHALKTSFTHKGEVFSLNILQVRSALCRALQGESLNNAVQQINRLEMWTEGKLPYAAVAAKYHYVAHKTGVWFEASALELADLVGKNHAKNLRDWRREAQNPRVVNYDHIESRAKIRA